MPSIVNTTIPISKAAVIIVSACGFLITALSAYYAAMNGVKDGFNELKLEIRDVENANKLQDILISGNTKNIEFNYTLIKELQEAMKPEELEIKPNKRYR